MFFTISERVMKLERRRLQAGEWFGKGKSEAWVARRFQVSAVAAWKWRRERKKDTTHGLKSKGRCGAKKRITEAFKAEVMTLPELRKEKTDIELSEEQLISERDALMMKLNVQHDVSAKIDLFKETCHKFLSKINDPEIVTERLKKDIIKLVIDEVVIEGESVKIFATIPLPNKIHEREMDKTDIPGTFNAGATLGPVNETNMARIWNKFIPLDTKLFSGTSKQFHLHTKTFGVGANPPLKRKIFVGMSGGVDSSVAAALLKRAGFDVVGVFIKVWEPPGMVCLWREDRRDAMKVAALLDIPLITLDLDKEYRRLVVNYMIDEYRAGRTPNPDVMCNKTIKFGEFYRRSRAAGADFVATGHYAQIKKLRHINNIPTNSSLLVCGENDDDKNNKNNKNKSTKNSKNNERVSDNDNYLSLFTSPSDKDQSYFLWNLTEDQLKHSLFPIGHLTKPAVRKLAKKFKLPNADKKDSQGLCFIGQLDMTEFLKNYIKPKVGKALDKSGKAIGRHDGAAFYTIGQRHGFVITQKITQARPYYVIGKDIKKNTITVSTNPAWAVRGNKTANLKKVNWISREPESGKRYSARIRYRQKLEPCAIAKIGRRWRVIFDKNQTALPAGQSLVVYDGSVCLGGGVIIDS